MLEKMSALSDFLKVLVNNPWWIILTSLVLPIISILEPIISYIGVKRKKYILVSIRDESNKETITIGLQMLVEIYKFFWPVILFLGITYTLLFWADGLGMGRNTKVIGIMLMLAILILLATLVHKCKGSIHRILQNIMLLLLIDIFTLFIIGNFHSDSKGMVYAMIPLATVFTYLGVGYSVRGTFLNKYYPYKSVQYIKAIRTILVIFFLICLWGSMLFGKIQYLESIRNIYFTLWILLCQLERVLLDRNDDTTLVEFELGLKREILKTKKKIIQCNQDKVKVVLKDRHTKVIDNDEINYIKYNIKNNLWRRKRWQVICTRKDGSIFEANECKYLTDIWVRFITIYDNQYEAVVIKSSEIREIDKRKLKNV